ncbi:MAG: Xaa-Pro peptidase family protein [Gemmatimonadaceae bacterium]
MLTPESLPRFQAAIAQAGLDGWLLYDFRGCNPIAQAMANIGGHITRRILVWIPRQGAPVAITHAIEQTIWHAWPNEFGKVVYSSWRALEAAVATLVRGKRIAMEYSPGDAVPVVDRVPAGVLEMVRAAGAEVVSSGDLVTTFYAIWTPDQLAAHQRAAEHVARVAREAMQLAGGRARGGRAMAEHELQQWIMDAFAKVGLSADHPANVSVGSNAANPHYQPSADHVVPIEIGSVILIDLWATEPNGVYADQTFMGSIGTPSDRVQEIWRAVRDARDAAIQATRARAESRAVARGAEIDDAARGVITARGFGEFFTHRTGHSIDARELHGAGPNLDNLETREERLLLPGVGFSIEPGIYIRGEIGVRSEVNAYYGDGSLIITPSEYQHDMYVL